MWSTIPKCKQHFTISRHALPHGGFLFHALRLFELARVPVRLDHAASLHGKNTGRADHGENEFFAIPFEAGNGIVGIVLTGGE